jgi:hypothetical protein
MKLSEMPHVIQFNKRDLPKLSAIEDMNSALNKYNAPFYESVATTGIGVQDTLKAIVKLVLLNLTRKYETKSAVEAPAAAVTAPAMAVAQMASVASASASHGATPVAVAAPAAPKTVDVQTRQAIPLSPIEAEPAAPRASARSAKRRAASPPPPVQTMSPFEENEIDGLVGEVEEIHTPALPSPNEEGAWMGSPEEAETPAAANDPVAYGTSVPLEDLLARSGTPASSDAFEVDRGFDPEWGGTPEPAVETVAKAAPPRVAEPDVRLTEVASDDDLFNDPSLEIAHLADGEGREIVVPVMLGEGPQAKRYKLAIRLRFHAVD